MNASTTIRSLLASAGLWLAPLVWAVNMQLGQLLPELDCRAHVKLSAITSFTAAAIAALTTVVSWRSGKRFNTESGLPGDTMNFIAVTSALAALLFTFALGLQGIAAMVLSGCER
jgi:hypothetical protein